jgi:acetyl-CoA synthetase
MRGPGTSASAAIRVCRAPPFGGRKPAKWKLSVGKPDPTTGESICAFVVLKGPRPTGDDAVKVAKELRDWVGKEIGPIAKPKEIRFGDNLPKTRSGKIMRRLLRVLAKGEEITQDISTLENPAILEQLKQAS